MNENEQMQKDLSASITDDEDDHLYQSSTILQGNVHLFLSWHLKIEEGIS
jgi:hypothetical protein